MKYIWICAFVVATVTQTTQAQSVTDSDKEKVGWMMLALAKARSTGHLDPAFGNGIRVSSASMSRRGVQLAVADLNLSEQTLALHSAANEPTIRAAMIRNIDSLSLLVNSWLMNEIGVACKKQDLGCALTLSDSPSQPAEADVSKVSLSQLSEVGTINFKISTSEADSQGTLSLKIEGPDLNRLSAKELVQIYWDLYNQKILNSPINHVAGLPLKTIQMIATNLKSSLELDGIPYVRSSGFIFRQDMGTEQAEVARSNF